MTTIRDKKGLRKIVNDRLRHCTSLSEIDEYIAGKEKSVDAVALLVEIAAVALIVVCCAVYLWRMYG